MTQSSIEVEKYLPMFDFIGLQSLRKHKHNRKTSSLHYNKNCINSNLQN